MSWQDQAIPLLRILINDCDPNDMEYDEGRLEELLIAAAFHVNQEMSFTTAYTIRVDLGTITPDPADNTTDGPQFINFMALKAACLADLSTYRTKMALAGLVAKCGDIMLNTANHLPGFKELLEVGPCASYEELKNQYHFGNTDLIKAVMTPFVSNDWHPPTGRNNDFFQ